MAETTSSLPAKTNDALVSQSSPEGISQLDGLVPIMTSERSAGHQQTGLPVDGNFHSAEPSVTFNTTQKNEASSTIADSKHAARSTKASVSVTVPPGKPNAGPSTPTVKKVSIYNVLVNSIDQRLSRLSIQGHLVLVLSSQPLLKLQPQALQLLLR